MKVYLDASIYLDLLDRSRQNSPHSIAWYRGNKNIPAWDFYFSGDFILHFIIFERKRRK